MAATEALRSHGHCILFLLFVPEITHNKDKCIEFLFVKIFFILFIFFLSSLSLSLPISISLTISLSLSLYTYTIVIPLKYPYNKSKCLKVYCINFELIYKLEICCCSIVNDLTLLCELFKLYQI